ncbi:hypothetical protein IPG36_00135 [bacterium]|nr:MAG: hypothetical protein IPG36_00135 [bacterium]
MNIVNKLLSIDSINFEPNAADLHDDYVAARKFVTQDHADAGRGFTFEISGNVDGTTES